MADVAGEDGTSHSWKPHDDIVKGSDYLTDQDIVEHMCRQASAAVIELEHIGTVWSKLENGKIAQRPFGGADFPRTCYAPDRTSHNALHTPYEHAVNRLSSTLIFFTFVVFAQMLL